VADRAVEVGLEALRELGRAAQPVDASQCREQGHDLAARAPRVAGELARQVAEAGADREAVATAVEAE